MLIEVSVVVMDVICIVKINSVFIGTQTDRETEGNDNDNNNDSLHSNYKTSIINYLCFLSLSLSVSVSIQLYLPVSLISNHKSITYKHFCIHPHFPFSPFHKHTLSFSLLCTHPRHTHRDVSAAVGEHGVFGQTLHRARPEHGLEAAGVCREGNRRPSEGYRLAIFFFLQWRRQIKG